MLVADFDGSAVEGLGVRRGIVENLALKTVFCLGETSIKELAAQLCITPFIVEGVFQRHRRDELMQAVGLAQGGHRVTLTAAGRNRAIELLGADQYVGPVPVSLAEYVERVRSQSVRDIPVTQAEVREAFRGLVLDESTLAQLGTSVIAGRAIFLHGAPGTGKTSVAEKLSELFRREAISVPYAVEVDGQIIAVFDPNVHESIEPAPGPAGDPRWVCCRRPRIMVGGELTIDMLDLQFNPFTRFYTAPVQMRANNGFLIVDDFGRQRIPPADLLNRWVVPLDRRVDFLTLVGGKKLQIGVFATNLDPESVVEEAFLRRIQTKINLGQVTPEQFHEIFRRACTGAGVSYDARLVDNVMDRIEHGLKQPLRACQPRDLINQITWRAKYEQHDPELSVQALDAACRAYFLVSGEA